MDTMSLSQRSMHSILVMWMQTWRSLQLLCRNTKAMLRIQTLQTIIQMTTLLFL